LAQARVGVQVLGTVGTRRGGRLGGGGGGRGGGRDFFLDLLGAGNGGRAEQGCEQNAGCGLHLSSILQMGSTSHCCIGRARDVSARGTVPTPARGRYRRQVPAAGGRVRRRKRHTGLPCCLPCPRTAPCWRSGRSSAIRRATLATAWTSAACRGCGPATQYGIRFLNPAPRRSFYRRTKPS